MRSVSLRSILFTTCLASAFVLPFTMSIGHAGFEWVPPAEQAPVPKMDAPQMPASPPAQVSAPSMAPPTRMESAQPTTLLPLEPLPGIDEEAPPLVVQHRRAPAPLAAQSETVIKVREFDAQPMALSPQDREPVAQATPRRAPPKVMDVPAPVMTDEPPLPELPSLIDENAKPTAVVVRNKIVMPEDAPKTARQSYDDEIVSPADMSAPSEPVAKINPMPIIEETPAPKTDTTFEVVEGFAKDIPLALALSQIVPANYSYSFAKNIDVGQRVSWDGGKAWNSIVEDMIKPLNLGASIQGNVIHIYNPNQNISSAPAAEMPVAALETVPTKPAPLQAKLPPSAIIQAADANARMPQHHRINIQDPGAVKTEQPKETLAVIKDLTRGETPPEALPEVQVADSSKADDELFNKIEAAALEAQEMAAADVPVNLVAAENRREPAPIKAEAPAVSVENANGIWEAQKGDSLKRTLDLWSKQANYEFVWNADHDYRLESDILVSGSFQRAVKSIFSNAMDPSESPLLTLLNQEKNQRGKVIIQDDDAA